MIGYVTLGTNDLEKNAKFYDHLLKELGDYGRMMEDEQFVAWGAMNQPGLGLTTPFDGKAASIGNGVMVALEAPDTDTVDRVHAKALALGGQDEGAPGPRAMPGFYAGYFRDLDGNKLNVFCMTGDGQAA